MNPKATKKPNSGLEKEHKGTSYFRAIRRAVVGTKRKTLDWIMDEDKARKIPYVNSLTMRSSLQLMLTIDIRFFKQSKCSMIIKLGLI